MGQEEIKQIRNDINLKFNQLRQDLMAKFDSLYNQNQDQNQDQNMRHAPPLIKTLELVPTTQPQTASNASPYILTRHGASPATITLLNIGANNMAPRTSPNHLNNNNNNNMNVHMNTNHYHRDDNAQRYQQFALQPQKFCNM